MPSILKKNSKYKKDEKKFVKTVVLLIFYVVLLLLGIQGSKYINITTLFCHFKIWGNPKCQIFKTIFYIIRLSPPGSKILFSLFCEGPLKLQTYGFMMADLDLLLRYLSSKPWHLLIQDTLLLASAVYEVLAPRLWFWIR